MKLHRFLGRRLAWATLASLTLFLALAVSQAVLSINRERSAVVHLLELSGRIDQLGRLQGPALEQGLRDILELCRSADFRHVEVQITDASGHTLARSDPLRDANPLGLWAGQWMHAWGPAPVETGEDSFSRHWQVGGLDIAIRPSLASEQSEAGTNLLISLAMLVGFSVVLLFGMKWVLASALRPLDDAIGQLQQLAQRQYGAALGGSRVEEVQRIHQTINELAQALAGLEASRQLLSARLISSQEDERAHISRELHDELGQKLTIIRFNTGYLQRVWPASGEAAQALADVQQAVKDIDAEMRSLLQRLRSHVGHGDLDNAGLERLLADLVQRWAQSPGHPTRYTTTIELGASELPAALLLTLFRITQEALTNCAKHAQASEVAVRIQREEGRIHWSVADNGHGLTSDLPTAMLRGNGLGGMQHRVWALGGTWRTSDPPGLRLEASLPIH